jgi:formamidopyrimidine-DNA glycosylase
MPEGHTIHRLAREHNALLAGRPIAVSSPQGRFATGAERLTGRVLDRVEPYGKHLFYRFEAELRLHVHLGLYGTFTSGRVPPPAPRGALRLRMATDTDYVDLRGPTACELIPPAEQAAIELRLGPDPLRPGARPDAASARVARSRAPIAALLLDQSVLAGVGNVYRAELLFVHRIDPFLPSRELGADRFGAMWTDLRRRMQAGVRAGRIVTTEPEHRSRRRGPVSREDAFYVYRRAGLPCRICGTEIDTTVVAARNLYWCSCCQAGDRGRGGALRS